MIGISLLLLLAIGITCKSRQEALEKLTDFIALTCYFNYDSWDFCKWFPRPTGNEFAPKKCIACYDGHEIGNCVHATSPGVSYDYWQPSLSGTQCGYTIGDPPNSRCGIDSYCLEAAANGSPALSVPPSVIVSGSGSEGEAIAVLTQVPTNGSANYPGMKVTIVFSKPVQASSLIFEGTLGAIGAENFTTKQTNKFSDTIEITPTQNWSLGANKTLVIKGTDEDSVGFSVVAKYSVAQSGSPLKPDFSTCISGCKRPWASGYSIQFVANGGIPPYQWQYTGVLPPGATFSSEGLLVGPATMDLLGVYIFGVSVIDSAGGVAAHPVKLDTSDLVSACFLLGICSL